MGKFAAISMLLCAWCSAVSAAAGQAGKCDVRSLSIEQSLAGSPLRLTNGGYLSAPDGATYVEVDVTNLSAAAPVAQIVLVLDYLDAADELRNEISFRAGSKAQPSQPSWRIRGEYDDDSFSQPLAVGDTWRVKGMSSILSMPCPTHARVTFLGLMLADGSTQSWIGHGWRLGPILNYFPADLYMPLSRPTAEKSVLPIRAKIDSRGRVAQIDATGDKPLAKHSDLLEQLGKWSFFPALADGEPVNSEVNILFQFLPDLEAEIEVDPTELRFPTIVIKAMADNMPLNHWRLFCAWRLGDTKLD